MTRDEFIKFKIKEKGLYPQGLRQIHRNALLLAAVHALGQPGRASLENVIKICNGLGISLSCLQKRDGISEDLPWELNEQEKTLINNYRARPMMQPAVNKLLDLEE